MDDRKRIVQDFVSSQASGKYVKEFVSGISTKKVTRGAEEDTNADDFLKAFNAGFKGLD